MDVCPHTRLLKIRRVRWLVLAWPLVALGVTGCGANHLSAYAESCDPGLLKQARSCSVQSPPRWETLQPGQAIHATVDAVCRRNPTGALLVSGATYEITVGNTLEPWKDAWVGASPDTGWSGIARFVEPLVRLGAVHRDAPMYSLLGQVESETAFHVGIRRELKSSADGQLYLLANDWPSAYTNNEGCLRVRIARAPALSSEPKLGR